ncbi:flagellar basal body L-ring protein FlgH [Chthonobacter rhizosphaerae]|uniref:flagellar basal body L-ring protein FlgH n=1 Tax=Chthonobacter rhizosphaerae TaxID=2735553 RepID=UPI0015EE9A34
MRTAAILVAVALGGCQAIQDVGQEPPLSPVGSGFALSRHDLPTAAEPLGQRSFNSLWTTSGQDLFKDSRARRVGDVVTVKISIDDRATLDNASNRERSNRSGFGLDFLFGADGVPAKANGTVEFEGSSKSLGRGSVDRSEEIKLSMAAIVVEVMPEGNLLVAGAQEVRVNAEMRVLQMSGIVRARDIRADNTIDYDKIAEARISYGGRGRLSEFQQPPFGQQVFDRIAPY